MAASVTDAVLEVFRTLYDQRFPIRRMEPVDVYGGDDDASMAADNTSGFNCRPAVADGPPHWSNHAYGLAIDVNPVENPYLLGGRVLPPAGADYLDRSVYRPGHGRRRRRAHVGLRRGGLVVGRHCGTATPTTSTSRPPAADPPAGVTTSAGPVR